MTYFVISEPEYKVSNWYKGIIDGLISEKRQKRLPLTLINDRIELEQLTIGPKDVIFVIGTSSNWLNEILILCESIFDNRVILLGNHENPLFKGKYSIVTSDIAHNIQVLYFYLKSCGKNRIAMYGINPASTSDAFRKKIFLSCGASETDLFYNSVSLVQCFENFSRQAENYDAVICVNDHTAISLVQHLNGQKPIFITSCVDGTLLTDFFSPSITHTKIDYESFGRSGIDLARILQNNKEVNSVHMYLAGSFVAGETTDFLPLSENAMQEMKHPHKEDYKYYSDPEIDEMIRIERLLNSCTPDDLLIINRILSNVSYPSIAEEFYLSTRGLKYKLRKMYQLCNTNSKTEFIDLLKKYIVKK